MALARRPRASTRRADDDQPRARTTPRRRPRRSPATPPRPSCTTSAATSPCPTHDGTLEIGGAVEQPDDAHARRPARHAGRRAGRHARVRRQRPARRCGRCPTGEPWGDYAVSTARWKGALLHEVLARRSRSADGVEVRFEGADHGSYHLNPILPETNRDDLTFVRVAAARPRDRPAAEILIAYEMNGEPLRPRPRRTVPAHRAALVRRRLGQVAQADRRAHRALRRRVPDRPLHLRVARPSARARSRLMRVRARITDPAPGRHLAAWAPTPCAARPGPAPGPITSVEVSLTGEGDWHPADARATERPLPVAGLDVRLDAAPPRPAHPPRPSHRRRRQRPTRGPAVEPAGLRQQRHRSDLRGHHLRTRPPRVRAAHQPAEP